MLSQYKKTLFFAAAIITTTLAFQNCGQAGELRTIDAFCGNEGGCVSASQAPSDDETSKETILPVDPRPTSVSPHPAPVPAPAPVPDQAPSVLMYNFVAGDKATCEASIQGRLGLTQSCSIGGGCGISCGMPGPGCPSANPHLYGACIEH